MDLTAFRIVQEALTNVTKHAATNTASVRLAYGDDRLTITVTNDTDAATAANAEPGLGFGIIGMRERAHSAGGHLQAGPRPEGGFTVTAELPIRTARTPMTIRVLLADDQALLRTTFRMLIEANPDMEVVGEAADGDEAVALTRTHQPRPSS